MTGTIKIERQGVSYGWLDFDRWSQQEERYIWTELDAEIEDGKFYTILDEGNYRIDMLYGEFGASNEWLGTDLEYLSRTFDITSKLVKSAVKFEVFAIGSIEIIGKDVTTVPIDVYVEETYTAEVYDANGNLLPNEKVKWSILEEIDGISIVEDTGALTVTSAVYNTGITSFTLKATSVTDSTVSAQKEISLQFEDFIPVTGITLTPEETAQLTAQIEPEDAINKNVTWTSSDTSIAEVEPNENNPLTATVTAITEGEATITVATEDGGYTAEAKVTVVKETGEDSEMVTFNDLNLEKAVRDALNKPEGDITVADMLTLTELDASRREIGDLTGIEYATNLTYLDLGWNQVSDINALSNLVNLTELYLYDNQISDISALSSLVNLIGLYLYGNQIRDISVLSNLTDLTYLDLSENEISDISALSSLVNLTGLYLYGNQIKDISVLSNLTDLTYLDLSENEISDISALSNLTNLTELDLSWNQVSDISALSSLTNLTYLRLSENQISDISALSSLTNLTELNLSWNQVSDISALSSLTNLTKLDLGWNKVSDISA
ncbi:leucine-rich repeat domain-containing protein, partial [Peptococcaceae bacterium]|nr:leucine-rich repeat domain-containing protein [Peptococcaceae bacterium]